MIPRTPEPELMDEPAQAEAYAIADFAEVNQSFVDRFRARFPALVQGRLLDLGCGPADIPIRIARALPGVHITAIDGADAMLAHGRRALAAEGLSDRVTLELHTLPRRAPSALRYDAVVSNSLLHHLHDPQVLWREVRSAAAPGAAIYIMDLMRPDSAEAARAIVETYAANERPILKSDFCASLLAAFTVQEVEAQLAAAGLRGVLSVQAISDRHLLIDGQMP